jgi:hypothetical protein
MNTKINSKILVLLLSLVFLDLKSQIKVDGELIDEKGNALPGATIKVLNTDSSLAGGATTSEKGQFTLLLSAEKSYILKLTHLSYYGIEQFQSLSIKSAPVYLGKIIFRESKTTKLQEVEIISLQQRGEQRGDSTSFNAGAFKTNPDATAEDLVKKMPGVTSDNSGLKVNGETVQKVLVDGKPFFGDDPNATVKNVPADMIDKVEFFDKMSDQAQFSGFNDGNQQKTMNIVTKKGKNEGQFGRVYGGIGVDENNELRYNGGASINSFKGARRISFLLLSNNINQQNFSMSDLSGVMNNSGQSMSGGGGSGGGGMSGNSGLFNSPQKGITSTQAAGLNYTDNWGKKISVTGSYFFNYTDNSNVAVLNRQYFTDDNLTYTQTNKDRTVNQNHRFNFRFEYAIDSVNKLIITPAVTIQKNEASSSLVAGNSNSSNLFLSKTITDSKNNTGAYDFSNNLLWQHKFKKQGRSFAIGIFTQLNEKNIAGEYKSLSEYSDTSLSSLDQNFNTYNITKKIAPNLTYTEGLTKFAQLQVSYNPSYTEGNSDKSTNDFNAITNDYSSFNSNLSNKYSNVYQTQRAGLAYKYNKSKLNFSFGADVQQSDLKGDQTYPTAFQLNQSFKNILPNAQLNYKFNAVTNLRVFYRSNTNIPSLNQLQNVIDVSNPLQLRSGNENLKQTFDHNLNIRFGGFNKQTSRNAMLFMNGSYTGNYIGTSTGILTSDTVIQNIPIKAGSQLSKPVNLSNYYNARLNAVYGLPVKSIKSNLNVNGGLNYNHTPSIINAVLNYASSYATNAGIFIGSNISEKLDFSLGYNANYTLVKNSVQKKSDNSYFTQSAMFKVNWIFAKGFVINTDITQTLYKGLSLNFNQEYTLWNAYVGYKFLKSKLLEAKISVFDILNQNRNISRTVTGSYTEDNNTTVLRRYLMFTLTYTIKHFKNGTAPKEEERPMMYPNGRPQGMGRPHE